MKALRIEKLFKKKRSKATISRLEVRRFMDQVEKFSTGLTFSKKKIKVNRKSSDASTLSI